MMLKPVQHEALSLICPHNIGKCHAADFCAHKQLLAL